VVHTTPCTPYQIQLPATLTALDRGKHRAGKCRAALVPEAMVLGQELVWRRPPLVLQEYRATWEQVAGAAWRRPHVNTAAAGARAQR
jgi:hypothetical protein